MRTAQQVLDQLLAFAKEEDAVRAVVMNGSRVNPNVKKDVFCDYDVVFFTADPRRFLDDQDWIARFGQLVILQQNDFTERGVDGFIFLMLFMDGVRIDLAFRALSTLDYVTEDSLAVMLLDKDQRLAPLPEPSERAYQVAKPDENEFAKTINEIFWCSGNIAKGLWRGELAYSKEMMDVVIRPCILNVLTWYAEVQHGWAVNPGKFCKWLDRYLPAELWAEYSTTYCGAGEAENWDALLTALRLVDRLGPQVAAALGYSYPAEDTCRMLAYLEKARALPKDAVAFE